MCKILRKKKNLITNQKNDKKHTVEIAKEKTLVCNGLNEEVSKLKARYENKKCISAFDIKL